MKTMKEIQAVKSEAEQNLLALPGVTGVGVGHKRVADNKTSDVSIVVYVRRKRPLAEIPAAERIPAEIDGVKTDVIEREFELKHLLVPVEELRPRADTGTYDPLRGGISIGPCRSVFISGDDVACHGVPAPGNYVFVGTLGAFVTDNATGAEMMLSNFHVMALDDAWSAGDDIAQPSLVDSGDCPSDGVGQLQRASLGGQVDCAVASHGARGWSCDIVGIGEVTGQRTASLELPVRKRGRTTGLTHGTVDAIDLTVTIPYCNGLGNVTLTGQISIDVDASQSTQFGAGGDSGSVVVDAFGRVLGLYFAGNPDGTVGVANPIAAVLTALDVSLCSSGTLKFLDDPVKTKVFDDPAKTKVFDDPVKAKVFDDPVKTKAFDDTNPFYDPVGPKLKFVDDVGTLPFVGTGAQGSFGGPAKIKALDDTNAFYDAVKTVFYDKAPWIDTRPAVDIGGFPAGGGPVGPASHGGGAAPFVMATPHHAHTAVGGGQSRAELGQLETWLRQREAALTRAYEQYEQGMMGAAAQEQFARDVAEYQAAVAHYRQLAGTQGTAGGRR